MPRKRIVADTVDGILMKKRRFLVEKRRDDDDTDPGLIEIPGGHVDKDETLEDALRREMKEELGIDVKKAKLIQKSTYTATNGERQRIHYFHVEKWKGRVLSKEAERVYWESEVSNLSIIPDRRAVRRIRRIQDHSSRKAGPLRHLQLPAANPELRATEKLWRLQRTPV